MAIRLRPQIVVHNPAKDRTLRGAAMERGIPAITVEVGNPQLFQPRYVKATRKGIRDIIAFDANMLPKKRSGTQVPKPMFCASSTWIYTDRGGLLDVPPDVAEEVSEGQPIALVRNAFGDPSASMLHPHAGCRYWKERKPSRPYGIPDSSPWS